MLPFLSIHQYSLEQNLPHSPAPPCREIQYVSFLMILGYQPLPTPPPPPPSISCMSCGGRQSFPTYRIKTVIGNQKKIASYLRKIAGACCWQAAQEPIVEARLLPSAKGSRHHGIYLSSNSVTVDFSTKQRFHCPAS